MDAPHTATPGRAEDLLAEAMGPQARFRPGQQEAITALVDGRRRVLVVQRTGWGKSVVYFIATRLLRDRGAGPTLLISPLLSLMRDQLLTARAVGVRAETINSANTEDRDRVWEELRADRCDLLLISPERLSDARFREELGRALRRGIGMLAIDEAHCISDWGHDFRPDYRRIAAVAAGLGPGVPVLATTATANRRVGDDIAEQLGHDLLTIRGPLTRPSLRIQTISMADQAERLAWLAERLPHLAGSGIIYCLTQADCERVAGFLTGRGLDVEPYHAGLDTEARAELEDRLRHNRVDALAATVALGMGFDKPDLGFVVHFQRPGSPVAYYQQIGRAGRALDDAVIVLLHGSEDDGIARFFISSGLPPAPLLRQIVAEVESAPGLTARDLQGRVNLGQTRLQIALKLLEIEGAVGRERSGYVRLPTPWEPDEERIAAVIAQREHELERMAALVRAESCPMEFLARELDDPAAAPCGRCAVCAGPFLPAETSAELVEAALAYLGRDHPPILPRKMWMGRWSPTRRGNIRAELRMEPGRALARHGTPGHGRAIAAALAAGGPMPDAIIDAAARMIRRDWAPDPHPSWVAAVPSRGDDWVSDLARRLAERLELPFRPALVLTGGHRPQGGLANSIQQARNAVGSFAAVPAEIDAGDALLVDDLVGSRWTLTACAALLREAGAGRVHPFALSTAGPGHTSA